MVVITYSLNCVWLGTAVTSHCHDEAKHLANLVKHKGLARQSHLHQLISVHGKGV